MKPIARDGTVGWMKMMIIKLITLPKKVKIFLEQANILEIITIQLMDQKWISNLRNMGIKNIVIKIQLFLVEEQEM